MAALISREPDASHGIELLLGRRHVVFVVVERAGCRLDLLRGLVDLPRVCLDACEIPCPPF